MNSTLLKTIIALIPMIMLLIGSMISLLRRKSIWLIFQLLGSVCLLVMVITHFAEALDIMSWMHWGLEHSAGHYLDLCSAILGLILFPLGYLLQSITSDYK